MVDTTTVAAGEAWASYACRGLSASVAAAAVLGGLRRLFSGYVDGPAAVLSVAAVPVLVGTSYGGEALFRAYLFGLPFLAFFAATLFFPTPGAGRSLPARAIACAFGLLLGYAFLLANNGKDRQYRFAPDEIAVAQWLYESAPKGTLLIEGARNYPSQFVNYENFHYVPLAEENSKTVAAILDDPAGVLSDWLNDPRWRTGFVILTRSQKLYTEPPFILPHRALDRIEAALLASPSFRLVKATPHTRVFALDPTVGRMGSWVR